MMSKAPSLPRTPVRQPSPPAVARIHKNTILTDAGRSPWYDGEGKPREAYIIGIAGGSASGKTRVAQAILKKLGVPWVTVVAQDMFYKSLGKEDHEAAFRSEYDFDAPEAFDYVALRKCIEDLKASKAVQIPNYSYLYGATVVIIEGIFALHDPDIRKLLDLKIFVQCDSDLMLARRLRRDLVERGRDPAGVIDQYLRFVKPSFDSFVRPTASHSDIIVPGQNNEISIDLIASHIRRQLDERKLELRKELFRDIAVADPVKGGVIPNVDKEAERELPSTVLVMEQTPQLKGIHTILRDQTTSAEDFIFMADRISSLVIEFALSFLPRRPKTITTGTPVEYVGQELDFDASHLCGVSILRSGSSLEKGLRRSLRDAPVGSVLIQSHVESGEPALYHVQLPECITASETSAAKCWVLLLDSQCGTGAAALMGIRVLLDHGVKEEQILFCCILASRIGGIWALRRAFPKVRVVTSAVDEGLEERWALDPKTGEEGRKKVFAIVPGMGSFGDRYYGS
ncbi:uridine kinase [Pseudohyphozyma bogoriensis]|nr:uridine kinase [Pseudohyphozyma bogoriensis]